MSNLVELAQQLIRHPSVTPNCTEVLNTTQGFLDNLGFKTHRMPMGEGDMLIDNLYATWGNPNSRMLFCGHVDVVPEGDIKAWRFPPFSAEIADGKIYGRGSVDMKGNIAAYFEALSLTLPKMNPTRTGLAVLITGDEEAKAIHGVRALMPVLEAKGEHWIGCLTGEPTSQSQVGDAYKRGRRGSLNGKLIIEGVQGHTGYPERAINAAHEMINALSALRAMPLDQGAEGFEPSWLAVSSIDIGNTASNVIPAFAEAKINFRYNTQQTSSGLKEKSQQTVRNVLEKASATWEWLHPSEPFLTPENDFVRMVTNSIRQATGITPKATTVGGTSDSRFIHPYCPVLDFGLCGKGMHEVDEAVSIQELHILSKTYQQIIIQHAQSSSCF